MINNQHLPKSLFTFIVLSLYLPTSQAVNWLILQGTEPAKVTHRPVIIAQPSYTKDFGNEITVGPNAGKRPASTMVAPWFDDDEQFHFRRARLGIRGNFTGAMHNDFTSKMNYFVLTEFAPNLINYDFMGNREYKVGIDHFSVTANHIEGARVRLGLFKTPGLEETYQGIIAQDYIEFTDFAAREVLERFVTGNARRSPSGGEQQTIGTPVTESQGFNAVRDWGVQLFDSFKRDNWDLTYAFMLGRGAEIQESERAQDDLEQYYYLSAEKDLPGGKGPWKHGIKYYTWLQNGTRVFESDPEKEEYDRQRYGIGIRSQGMLFGLENKQRFAIDYMHADGMLFVAPAGGVKGGPLMFAAEDENKSRAVSIDYAYFFTNKIEAMIRWDKHELLYETDGTVWTDGDARDIETMTYGIQYHFQPKLKLAFNYIDRDVTAPNENHPVVNEVTSSIGSRYTVQLTWIY